MAISKYFRNFPSIYYDTIGDRKQFTAVKDILRRVKITDRIKENIRAYYEYYTREGDTAEIIADKLYGNSDLYWIVEFANEIEDPFFEWSLPERTFQKFMTSKYPDRDILMYDEWTGNNFTVGEGVTSNTGATANVVSWDASMRKLTINNISGTFLTTNNVSGDASTTLTNIFSTVLETSGVHHYEDDDRNTIPRQSSNTENYIGIINSGGYGPVTNLQYEEEENQKKKKIKLFRPEFVDEIVDELSKKINK